MGDELSSLIQGVIDGGLSARAIALRSREAGHELGHAYVSDLARKVVVKAPRVREIEALAAGTGLEPRTIAIAAAAQYLGLRVPGCDREQHLVVELPEGFPDNLREHLAAFITHVARHWTRAPDTARGRSAG